jgi:hypothetical protein
MSSSAVPSFLRALLIRPWPVPASKAAETPAAAPTVMSPDCVRSTGPGRRAAYSLTEASIQLVPVFAQLGDWGLRHHPTTKRLRVRTQLIAAGGPTLWVEFMDELRATHLGAPAPKHSGPIVMERLSAC